MSDLARRLRATQLDKDNFPRMKQEKWLPVGLALEAADEIERLEVKIKELLDANGYTALALAKAEDEIERLEAYVEEWKRRYETARLAHEEGRTEIERLKGE